MTTLPIAYRTIGSLLVIRQRREACNDADWRALLKEASAQDFSKLRILVVTEGGGPTVEQRAALKAMLAGRQSRTAVLSDSVKVRFVTASIALFNRAHHGFAMAEIEAAYRFLDLSSTERAAAQSALAQMNEQL